MLSFTLPKIKTAEVLHFRCFVCEHKYVSENQHFRFVPVRYGEVGRVLKPGGTFFLCNESDGDHAQDEKWTEKIPGMTIYKDTQLKTMLEQVGFRQVETHKNGKGWLCVTARK